MRRCDGAIVIACALLLTLALAASEQPRRGLTAVPELARVYDAIFDARFQEVPALRARACVPAPAEACQLLDALALWWRIQLDPFDTSRDAAFLAACEAAIAASDAWTQREPARAEAWFYLGGAYAARVQWQILRGERLAAARDGKRIKEAVEQALALDPALTDAYFGIGLYHYYADVGPRALRMLRWLLLLPGGDRVRGLREMLQARSGQLVRSEADYQLHVVYLWYEKQPERALDLLRDLQTRHPHNPHFLQAAAEIQDFYIDDTEGSLRTWRALLDAAQRGQVAEAKMAEVNARLGIASQIDQLGQSDLAVEQLRPVIAAQPPAPVGAVARAHLQLGHALGRLARRDEAAASYRNAIVAAGPRDPLRIAAQARAGLRALRR